MMSTRGALLVAFAVAALPAVTLADNASSFRDTIPRYGGADEFDVSPTHPRPRTHPPPPHTP